MSRLFALLLLKLMLSRAVGAVLFILSIIILRTLRVPPGGPEIGPKMFSPGQITRNLEVTHAQMAGVFEANQGQAEELVKFLTRGPEYVLLLTQRKPYWSLPTKNPATVSSPPASFE